MKGKLTAWERAKLYSGKGITSPELAKLDSDGRFSRWELAQLYSEMRFTPRELARLYLTSYVRALGQDHVFADLRAFCLFIGYPHSGHSLIGSLLDAHPRIVVAHELDTLRYVDAHFSARQIYQLLLANSQQQARRGREHEGYSYVVPNQWQGRFDELEVIGDKKGGITTLRLQARPGLLRRLKDTVGIPPKLVHVIRNPYDNIGNIARKFQIGIPKATEAYFSMCETVARVTDEVGPEGIIHVRQEALVQSPAERLSELCRFLGTTEPPPTDYLRDCSSIIVPQQSRGRDEVRWTPTIRERVAREMQRYGFLRGYSFDA
jgi:hypothetical protein